VPPKDNPITEGKLFDNNYKERQISWEAKFEKDLEAELKEKESNNNGSAVPTFKATDKDNS
jgi:hypothetical protein